MKNKEKGLYGNNQLINSNYYFEALVLNAVNKKLDQENKVHINKYVQNDKFGGLQGIIPEGIGSLVGQTVVEVKLIKQEDINKVFSIIINALERITIEIQKSQIDINSILFIIGSSLKKEEKIKLENEAIKVSNYSLKLWDLNDLCEIDKKFNYFKNGDFSKIAEFVVADVVNDALKQKDDSWKKIREERLNELKKIYLKDKLVLFLGAGVSKEAGIREWGDLISDLRVLMIKRILEKNEIEITEQETNFLLHKMKEINNHSPLLQVAFIKAALGEEFEKNISKLLYKSIVNDGESKLLNSISKLSLPKRNAIGIQAVVTYNFDDLLEHSFNKYNIEYQSLYSEFDYPSSDKLGIYHVHGFLPRNPENYEQLAEGLLVFSEDGYHNLYNDPYSWTNITQLNFLRENTALMIGLSLTDPNLRRLLAISNRKNKLKRHYAIMKKENFTYDYNEKEVNPKILNSFNIINNDLQEKFFEQLGINIIWVEEFDEIPDIIKSLRTL